VHRARAVTRKIDLVYFNAGGGHRAAATALETVIRAQERPWQVRLVNLMKVLDPKDVFRKTTGMDWEDVYNSRLARGWSVGLAQELKLLQAAIRLSRRSMVSRLRRHWRKGPPDMVVSLIPNFNRPMYEAIASLSPRVPYVTLLTDFADYPPHFWIEPRQAQHFICGTAKAAGQARALGYGEDRVHLTSGMIIRPDFYAEEKIDRRAELRKLGLDADRPTGLVMFGGHGSRAMRGIAKRLADVQLIMICGHNAALAERLSVMSAPASAPRAVLGFTSQMRHYMQLADFFIGKPGPGSISEAVQQGLPVVVVRNTWTMPQERYNTDWVLENGAGIVLESFRYVDEGVRSIIARLSEFKANLARIENRAVFEIPEILGRILESPARHGAALGAPGPRASTLVH
jgi:UDP-N-acetylglucosamine:LPS N-acetylglucosamine transferase